MKIEEQITNLLSRYCELISGDHHKNRDCHWTIETRWSYGNAPKYVVIHNGYIQDRIEIDCETYNHALSVLRQKLKDAVEQEELYKEAEEGATFPNADVPGELRAAYEL